MKVILAKPRGFCAGVVRAIEIVERALDKYGPPVYVRHEIVHNKWVVDALKARGARFVEDLSEVPPDAITIFSAHGVAKKVVEEAAERGLRVLNATCPLVSKVHAQGRHYIRNGRTVILVGHAGHPEVEGTLGQIPGPVLLVQTEKDVDALDLPANTPIAYVTQTTLSVDDTRGIIAALFRRFSDVVGPGTEDICYATQNRQTALLQLTRLVDAIFVVGAKNSSNSNRLQEIGLEAGIPTHLIANGSEIKPEWLKDVEVVGITAGASAPEVMVRDVINALRRITPVEVFTLPGQDEHIEFRVPVELLDVPSAQQITKDSTLGHSPSAEAISR
jgi:4-hydroxy-3-methylbut-2-enyl diphosphate reductase